MLLYLTLQCLCPKWLFASLLCDELVTVDIRTGVGSERALRRFHPCFERKKLPGVFQFIVLSLELPACPLRCSNMRNRKRTLVEFCRMPSVQMSFVAICVFLSLFLSSEKYTSELSIGESE